MSDFRKDPSLTSNGIKAGSEGTLWFTELNGNKIGRITTKRGSTEAGRLSDEGAACLDSNTLFEVNHANSPVKHILAVRA